MIDIEKMRQEMQQKIEWAEMSNRCSLRLKKGGEIFIIGKSPLKKGKLQASAECMNKEQVGEVLNTFPVTKKSRIYIECNKYKIMDYSIKTLACMNGLKMIIEWISGDLHISATLIIPDQMKDFFRIKDENVEFSYVAGSRKRLINLLNYIVPCDFKDVEIRHPYIYILSKSWIAKVIEYLKGL